MARKYKPHLCPGCRKWTFFTEARARGYIGHIVRKYHPLPGTFALQPFQCPRGKGWHVGRNPRVLEIDFTKGRLI
jgi:hypothetical protein